MLSWLARVIKGIVIALGFILPGISGGVLAAILGIYERDQIFKTLALLGDKTGPIIGIVPITQHLSEKKLAKISGNKKVSMIPQKDLEKTTGYIHGANNPVGIRQKHNYPIFIDKIALDLDRMIVSAGEVGHSIIVAPQDLASFVKADFVDILEDIK
ncbi:YbaK/EbsC family protein [Streptococcus pneumoniae]